MAFDKEAFFKKQIEECPSLRGKRPTQTTKYFGSKLFGVGRNSFARPEKLNDAGGNSRNGFYARRLKAGDQIRKRPPQRSSLLYEPSGQGFGGWVAVPARY